MAKQKRNFPASSSTPQSNQGISSSKNISPQQTVNQVKEKKTGKFFGESLPIIPDFLIRNLWIQAIILFLLAFVLYGNTIGNEYVLDDKIVFTENNFVKKGFSGIWDILSHDSFLGHFGKNQESLLQGGRYRPLSLVSFAIEYQIFGANPTVGHLINVLLFAVTPILMLILLRKYILPPVWAFLTCILFVIHPIHTEVVANIKSRDEIMGWLFCIATLYFIIRAAVEFKNGLNKKVIIAVFISCISFILALLSKENTLAYIAIIPMAIYYFGNIIRENSTSSTGENKIQWTRIAALTIPFIVIVGLYFGIRSQIDGGFNAEITNKNVMNDPFLAIPKDGKTDIMNPADSKSGSQKDVNVTSSAFSQKYGTIMYVLGRYVGLLVFPHPMSWDYSYPQLIHVSDNPEVPHKYRTLTDSSTVFCILLYLAITAIGVIAMMKRKKIGFGIMFFLFTLFIVSNITINIGGFMADRFLYQPSFSFCIVLAAGILWLNNRMSTTAATRRIIATGALCLIVIAGSAKTIIRNMDWKNENSLFIADVQHAPNSAHTNKTAAGAYYRMATADGKDKNLPILNETQKREYLEKSISYYLRSLELYPTFPDAISDIVVVWRVVNYYRDKENEKWKQLLRMPLAQYVEKGYPGTNKAMAQRAFDEARNNRNNNELAILKLQEALTYDPLNVDYWYILGSKVYFKEYNYEQGARCFRKVLEIAPNNADYWHDLGVAYHNNRNYNEAFAAFDNCLKLNPNHANVKNSYNESKKQFQKEGKSYPLNAVPS